MPGVALPHKHGPAREQAIFDAVKNGRIREPEWVELGTPEILRFWVMADALQLEDGLRVNVTHATAQRIADLMDCVLPTTRISDMIWLGADVRIGPCLQNPCRSTTEAMWRHSEDVRKEIEGRKGLVAPVGKDWVLTNRLAGRPDRAANYGLHDPAAPYSGPGTPVKLWQPLGLAHNIAHTDYSQVVRLVKRVVVLDGEERFIEDVLQDPRDCDLLSDEGALQILRHPGVAPEEPPAGPMGALEGSLGERCVQWSLRHLGVREQPPRSNTGPEIKPWLSPCVRRSTGKLLGLTASNWCFTGDTEILTEHGWLRFDVLSGDERVAQVSQNDLKISLTRPEDVVHRHYYGRLVMVDRRSVRLVSDPEHRYFGRWMISSRELGAQGRAPSMELRPIADLLGGGSQVSVPTAAGIEDQVGVELSDRDLRLLAAFIADGSIVHGKLQFQVSRNDKIAMLHALGPTRVWTAPRAYGLRSRKPLTSFFFAIPDWFLRCFSAYKLLASPFIWSLNRREAALLLDTVAEFDGSCRGGSVTVSQSSKDRADMLQILAVLAGYSCQTRIPRTDGEFGSTMYTLAYTRHPRNTIIHKDDVRQTENVSADLYCVRVPDSLIIVRPPGYGRALIVGNCAAFASAALEAAAGPGEGRPHGYYAAVVEIEQEAAEKGIWRPVDLVLRGQWEPEQGDLATYDRSKPGRPETAWWRHVNRVVKFDRDKGTFAAVGGNEADQVRLSEQDITKPTLRGFVEYPDRPEPGPEHPLTEEERTELKMLVDMGMRELLDQIAESSKMP